LLLAGVRAVLAGVDPLGGFGTVLGVLLAGFALGVIRAGFVALELNQFLYEAAQGGILIFVLAAGSLMRGDMHWLARLRKTPK